MPNPTKTPAWQRLRTLRDLRPTQTSAAPKNSHPLIHAAGLTADFSRQHVDAAVLAALNDLQATQKLADARTELFAGAAINRTEKRNVEHVLLRTIANMATNSPANTGVSAAASAFAIGVNDTNAKMAAFSDGVRRGARRSIADQSFTDVVVIGIGGSALGPELVCSALTRFADGPRVHFVANLDGAHLEDTLAGLQAQRTVFVVISKTFTTDETLTNSLVARAWLSERLGDEAFAKHFVAVTANPVEAGKQGYTPDNIFAFAEGVGGRLSLWSAVGLPIVIRFGMDRFRELLAGAHAMDMHFRDAPFHENMPVLLACIGVWNRNFCQAASHAVLPYAQRLSLLPKHLQQLEMESNGKSVDLDGNIVGYATSPVIFGEAGTNGQHSFHQLLHQGTDTISADIIIVRERESNSINGEHANMQHNKLLANAFAQANAFWDGVTRDDVLAKLTNSALTSNERHYLAQHKAHRGGQPVTMIELPRLDAFHLGALLALYEQKTFVQGVLWNINSFDQFGVELGKTIARELLAPVSVAVSHKDVSLLATFQNQ